jgi:putative cell wall-binding protein
MVGAIYPSRSYRAVRVMVAFLAVLALAWSGGVASAAVFPQPTLVVVYGSVSGHVNYENVYYETVTGPGLFVRLEPVEGRVPPGYGATLLATTDSSGNYVFASVPVGDYQAFFYTDPSNSALAPAWYGDTPYRSNSPVISVTASGVTGVDARLPFGSSISGHLTFSDDIPVGNQYADVEAYLYDPAVGELERFPNDQRSRLVDAGGDFTLSGLYPGQYLLRATSNAFDFFDPEYWPHGTDWIDSQLITVGGARAALTGYDLNVGPPSLTVTRLGGANRYDTAAQISRYLFPPASTLNPDSAPDSPPDTVWIANGDEFPDALSAGPAAAMQGAPILLVSQSKIPGATRAELLRLHPSRIVVVGGIGVISPQVFTELGTMGATVRLGGTDRYETSRLVVREGFLTEGTANPAPGAYTSILANGSNYPDALAAGPAAVNLLGPVILVRGSDGAVDEPTKQLLHDLATERVYLAGGTGSIRASFEGSLASSGDYSIVARLGGTDRYATSVAINARAFELYDRVFLATGTGFADAVAGAPVAAMLGAPIVLNPQNCLSDGVWARFPNLNSVILLGGTASLSAEVEQLHKC